MLQTDTAKAILNKEDQLGLMLAALCHDLDHDGRTNAFHKNARVKALREGEAKDHWKVALESVSHNTFHPLPPQTELARLYNDIHIMENHHAALMFEVLNRKDCALLVGFGFLLFLALTPNLLRASTLSSPLLLRRT